MPTHNDDFTPTQAQVIHDLGLAIQAAASAFDVDPSPYVTKPCLVNVYGVRSQIPAIKRLREATGCGLKEAKDIIDTVARLASVNEDVETCVAKLNSMSVNRRQQVAQRTGLRY